MKHGFRPRCSPRLTPRTLWLAVATFEQVWELWKNHPQEHFLRPYFGPIEPPQSTIEKRFIAYQKLIHHPVWPSDLHFMKKMQRMREAAYTELNRLLEPACVLPISASKPILEWMRKHWKVGHEGIGFWLEERVRQTPWCPQCETPMERITINEREMWLCKGRVSGRRAANHHADHVQAFVERPVMLPPDPQIKFSEMQGLDNVLEGKGGWADLEQLESEPNVSPFYNSCRTGRTRSDRPNISNIPKSLEP
jgi:hypothetical protein